MFLSAPKSFATQSWSWLLGLAAMLLAAGLYYKVVGFGFCNLDDPYYVLANKSVQQGLSWQGLRRLVIPEQDVYWSPLTLFSLMLDQRFFGGKAGGFHLVNALWHCANVGLFFALVLRLSGSRLAAFWAALFFAAHPVHVEAVAWISARKDVLSTFFGLAAIHLYLRWQRKPGPGVTLGMYTAYFLSLLAKPMFVTLAGLLLLLDYWPLARLSGACGALPEVRLLLLRAREKVLFLAFGLLATYLTMTTHFVGYDRLDPSLGLKFANAVVAYVKYLGLLFWPMRLGILYPFPESVPLAQALAAGTLLAVLTVVCLRQLKARPYLAVGWLWFLVALLPVIMPPKVGLHVELADRWAYVPFLGLYLALGCLGAEFLGRVPAAWPRRALVAAWLLAPLTFLGVLQQRQLATWATPYSIYDQVLKVTHGNYLVLFNYGALRLDQGDTAVAEDFFNQALEAYPGYPLALYNMGILNSRQGRYEQALEFYMQALEGDVKQGHAYIDYCAIAYCLVKLGRAVEAPQYYVRAIEEDPTQPRAYTEWGNLALAIRDRALARDLYLKALEVDPDDPVARECLRRLADKEPARP